MYRINYSNPVSLKFCSRTFKTLKAAYRFMRDFSCSICFEVIPIGTSEEFYVFYDLFDDVFIINTNDDVQNKRKLVDINE